MTAKTGFDALLTPERSVLLLIDHQAFQFANLHSHEPTLVVNNVVGLAKAAKAFKVPTILTTVTEERGGYLLKGIQDVFPTQKPINRTFINTWEDHGGSAHGAGRGRADHLDRGHERVAARLGTRSDGSGHRRGHHRSRRRIRHRVFVGAATT